MLTCLGAAAAEDSPTSRLREEFLQWRFGLFLHFNMATFTDQEWATGHEDPLLFQPRKLDCGQWADAAKAAGMNYAVLTVKHTEGYCLWDSAHTTHDIASFTRFRDGKGDLVREFTEAFRKRGLKVGLYYCFPGDFSGKRLAPGQKDLHGLPPEAEGDFIGFIRKQMTELLTRYGRIDLLWIDQYYNKYTGKRWLEIMAHVKALQPDCVVVANNADNLKYSDVASYEFPWSKKLPPEGNAVPSEVCDTIQKNGWFWHPNTTPEKLQSAAEIVNLLQLCNSRRANYLLNVPPDRDGLISEPHLSRLHEIGKLRVSPPSPAK